MVLAVMLLGIVIGIGIGIGAVIESIGINSDWSGLESTGVDWN